MSSAFLKMKKNREKLSEKRMQKVVNDGKNKNKYKDDRMYYPERDKNGNGYAVIRFLPAKDPEALPYVKTFDHGFKDVGGWLIENCPTTIGKPCPICEDNSKHWRSETQEGKKLAGKRKRKKKYFANIYVVSDSKNPENEGKVFLFQFGQKIFEMIMAASNPEFEDEKPVDPFDMWEGANFKLKIVKKDGNTNYDRSEFEDPSQLAESDEDIEEIWNRQYDLNEFIDPSKFKSYGELEERLARVMGGSYEASTAEEDDVPASSAPTSAGKTATSKSSHTESNEEEPPFDLGESDDGGETPQGVDEDDEDPLSFFENAAAEDS